MLRGTNMIEGNYRIQIDFLKGRRLDMCVPPGEEICADERVSVVIAEQEEEGCCVGRIRLRMADEDPLQLYDHLAAVMPVRIYAAPAKYPEKITAMYMYNPWWTRPAFAADLRDIPEKTQAAFLQLEDCCACLLPMAGSRFKTTLRGGTETELCLEMTACVLGLAQIQEDLYLYAEAPTVQEAVHRVFSLMLRKKGIPPRESRRVPEMLRYLGWCSWDAFYTEVTEEKIRAKAQELAQKNVPVRWMLIDDGWFPSRDKMIRGFHPDPEKFPEGFRKMTEEIRGAGQVRWFGVWHALGGYWGGVDPLSDLAADEALYLHRGKNGRLVPDPERGSGFYRDWCDVLKEEGIDFIKVDGQSAVPIYFENEIPLCEAARGIGRALESGAYRMDGAIINCMGMAMENIAARPSSAVSRNSDDFLPMKEESFAEHLLQNAYNAVYHNEIYCCDWDMFWSEHVHAVRHSLLRAVSGGPVYVSDRISRTDPDVLRPLAYRDGRILMMNRSAKPTQDCMFQDPRKGGVLKLHNIAAWGEKGIAGGIAACNLTRETQTVCFKPTDIPDLEEAQQYWVFDYFGRKVWRQGKTESYTDEVGAGEIAWYVILPAGAGGTCLGLLDKYVGFSAVESVCGNEDMQVIVLHETGTAGWTSEKRPVQVLAGAEDVTGKLTRDGALWTLPLPEKEGRLVLTVKW